MAKPWPFLALSLLLLVAVGLAGCGYTLTTRQDGQRVKDHDAQEIAFGMARNQVTPPRPGLEYDLTRRLKSEIAHDRRFELSESSSLRLEITLVEYGEPIQVRDFNNKPTEVAIHAEAEVRVTRGEGDPRLGRVSAWTSYSERNGESREEGLDRLWRELSREVLDFVDDFDWLKAAKEAIPSVPSKEAANPAAKG